MTVQVLAGPLCSTVLSTAKAARVLAALKRDGWTETGRPGLAPGTRQGATSSASGDCHPETTTPDAEPHLRREHGASSLRNKTPQQLPLYCPGSEPAIV